MRIWMKNKALPYVVGKHRIMVTISHDGLSFHKKGKREHVHVPWEKVMPWRGIYDGDGPTLTEFPAVGERDG